MIEKYYRFIVRTSGIYEVVDRDCPKSDVRRKDKPDGSWLPKVGMNYPGAISFWKEKGLRKYIDSGLMEWHASVMKEPVFVLIGKNVKEILYEDEYQIICKPDKIFIGSKVVLASFLNEWKQRNPSK